MPLNADHELAADAFRRAFDGFDDTVLRTARGDAKSVARSLDGLVMAGVDGQTRFEVRGSGFEFRSDDLGQEGVGSNGGRVRDGDSAAGAVIHGQAGEVLDQRSAAPDVEHLCAETNREDWFAHVVGVLEQEFVDVFAGRIGGIALLDRLLAVFLRIDVRAAAGQQNALAVRDEFGGCGRRLIERHFDGLATAALYGRGVSLPGTAVVVEIRAGGNGDGDARGFHRFEVRGTRFEERLNADQH